MYKSDFDRETEIASAHRNSISRDLQGLARRVEALERAERERPEILTRREVTDIAFDCANERWTDQVEQLEEKARVQSRVSDQLESWRAWAAGVLSKILVKLEMLPGEEEPVEQQNRKAFVVMSWSWSEGEVDGVFTSKEKAEEYIRGQPASEGGPTYSLHEFNLDVPSEGISHETPYAAWDEWLRWNRHWARKAIGACPGCKQSGYELVPNFDSGEVNGHCTDCGIKFGSMQLRSA